MLKNFNLASIVLIIIIGLFVGVISVYATWTTPPLSPPACPLSEPGCNLPINISNNLQYKSGGLGIGGVLRGFSNLLVTGATTNPVGSGCPLGYHWFDNGNGVLENGECFRTALYTNTNGNVGIGAVNLRARLNVNSDNIFFGPDAGVVAFSNAQAIYGVSQNNAGVVGTSNGGIGVGVQGIGTTWGGYFTSGSGNGLYASSICLGNATNCRNNWPAGGGGAETDPTVNASVKDGVGWGEVSGIPAGFADGVDNVGAAVAEADTLNSVTTRGNTTANSITVDGSRSVLPMGYFRNTAGGVSNAIEGHSNSGYGVYGNTNSGVGGSFVSTGAGAAIRTQGRVEINNGSIFINGIQGYVVTGGAYNSGTDSSGNLICYSWGNGLCGGSGGQLPSCQSGFTSRTISTAQLRGSRLCTYP